MQWFRPSVWLPSKKIVCPSFRNIEIAVKRRPTARWTTNSLRARKLLCYFNPFPQFFRLSNNHPIIYIYIFLLVLSLLNLFSLLLLLNSNGKYGREEIFPSLSFVPAIGDKLYSQKYNFLFRLRVLADSSLVARHFRERRIRRFSCSLRGQQLPPPSFMRRFVAIAILTFEGSRNILVYFHHELLLIPRFRILN